MHISHLNNCNNNRLDDFKQDFNETGTWAITTWVRAKPGSLGMPSNFWFVKHNQVHPSALSFPPFCTIISTPVQDLDLRVVSPSLAHRFGLFLYSQLAPPLTLAHFNEPYPQYEPWMNVYTTTLQRCVSLGYGLGFEGSGFRV